MNADGRWDTSSFNTIKQVREKVYKDTLYEDIDRVRETMDWDFSPFYTDKVYVGITFYPLVSLGLMPRLSTESRIWDCIKHGVKIYVEVTGKENRFNFL